MCFRVEYDAYRTDLETLQLGPRDATTTARIDEAQRKFSAHKEKFDRLRGDVAIKLKFLEENKVMYHIQAGKMVGLPSHRPVHSDYVDPL